MGKNAFSLGADFLSPNRMGDLCAEYFDLAAIGLPQESGEDVYKRQVLAHQLFSQFLIVERVGGLPSPALSGVVSVYGLQMCIRDSPYSSYIP